MPTIFKTTLALGVLTLVTGLACCNYEDPGPVYGQSGFTAAFVTSGDYMYTIQRSNLYIFKIGQEPVEQLDRYTMDSEAETIFIHDKYLYIGVPAGMHVFSLADPAAPAFVLTIDEVTACDVIAIDENKIYVVTPADGNRCKYTSAGLKILTIADPPTVYPVTANYPAVHAYGLDVDDNLLFLATGAGGLVVYDVTDEANMKLLAAITTHTAYDVTVTAGIAQVRGHEGIFQYRYDPAGALQLLSTIPVVNENP